MLSLLDTEYRVDLPNFILISSYSIIADKGLEYIYKHQNIATLNQWLAELQIYGAPAPLTQDLKKMVHNFSR